MSSEHCRIRAGVLTCGSSDRVSERKVVRAKWWAMSGSVWQKLLASSDPSSGQSGLPITIGAMAAAQAK